MWSIKFRSAGEFQASEQIAEQLRKLTDLVYSSICKCDL